MAKKTAARRHRNRQDSTLRNVQAANKRLAGIVTRIDEIWSAIGECEHHHDLLEARIEVLEAHDHASFRR